MFIPTEGGVRFSFKTIGSFSKFGRSLSSGASTLGQTFKNASSHTADTSGGELFTSKFTPRFVEV